MRQPIFDAHLHIIDPAFPLQANQGYLPPPFSVADYRGAAAPLGIAGGAVVSGSFQGFDQSYLTAALAALGEGYVGVTQLPATVADAELDRLAAAGVRALRFNLYRGGSQGNEGPPLVSLTPSGGAAASGGWVHTDYAAQLLPFARRVHDRVGWHVELYIGGAALAALAPSLREMLAAGLALSVDHLGLEAAALPVLLPLVERGARVKATGFSRVDFAPADTLRRIHAANPQALMFGTDLPSTRAPRPFAATDLALLVEALGETALPAVLWQNARNFYRLERT